MVAIVGLLAALAMSFRGRSGGRALSIGVERLAAAVERARMASRTSGKPVMLALAGPGHAAFGDAGCRLGIFELDAPPEDGAVNGRLLERWQLLPEGLGFSHGAADDWGNVMDIPALAVHDREGARTATYHGLVIGARGGLRHPPGSSPVVVRVGRGREVDGAWRADGGDRILRVGRAWARPWHVGP